jgi:carbon monoxide dehydrogenase subunit G
MHVERTLTVPRPVEAVFDYLADFTHTDEWDPGTVETRRTSGDGGVGTTYANVSEFLGRRAELEYTTVTLERPARLEFRGRNSTATATDSMTFSRAADGTATEVHYRADFDFGLVLNLVAPLVLRRRIERLADDTVAQLERTLLNHA